MTAPVMLLDDADAGLFDGWYVGDGYARQYAGDGVVIAVHRVVLERAIGRRLVGKEECDHINGNRLDNRRANLRVATRKQNAANKPKHRVRGATSRFKGVQHKPCRRDGLVWRALVRSDGRRCLLGYFGTEGEAARAYDRYASARFGEFARLNFPDEVHAPNVSHNSADRRVSR